MTDFEEAVREALWAAADGNYTRGRPLSDDAVDDVILALAPRVAAAIRVTGHHLKIGGTLREADELALRALRAGLRGGPPQ